MKYTNVKKTVLTGIVMGAALFTFNFTALPGSVNLPAVVQAAEANFTGVEAGKLYLTGQLYTGVALKDGKLYNYKEGVQGAAYTGTFTGKYLNVSTGTQAQINGVYYQNGSVFSGVAGRKYYVKGLLQSKFTGWKKVGGKIYYFTKGVAPAKGFKMLKSYTGGSTKYKYYFKEDGSLSTNLFKDWGYNKCIKTKMTIEINTKTHNVTFYLYDKKTKKYIIPAKTVLCSTSAKANGTPRGHFFLMKTSAKRWVRVPNNNTRFYQWATRIAGTPTLVHSSVYTKYGNNKALSASYYNKLGNSNTSYCVRMQAVNAKIVYDVAKKTPKKQRTWINIVKKNKKGPFGIVKLKHTTGKLKNSRKTDPTDPVLFPGNPFSVK